MAIGAWPGKLYFIAYRPQHKKRASKAPQTHRHHVNTSSTQHFAPVQARSDTTLDLADMLDVVCIRVYSYLGEKQGTHQETEEGRMV